VEPLLPDKWVEIDLDAIEKNLLTVKSLLAEETRLIAVIKANAYGHGAVETARILMQNGVDDFAVSFFHEAMQLRRAGIRSRILVFSPIVMEQALQEAIEQGLTPTIASPYDWQMLDQISTASNMEINVHLKVDTGLGRFGLREAEVLTLIPEIKKNTRIHIEGIYTHMAAAASNPAYTRKQFSSFMQTLRLLAEAGVEIPIRHCANSAVLLTYPQMQLDAVRIGTLLSGQVPVGTFKAGLVLEDPYKFKTRIIAIRNLDKGSYLGYYRSYRLKKSARVAVIPVGFNDGLALQVANKSAGWLDLLKTIVKTVLLYLNVARFGQQVIIKGIKYPVRGKVFMQMALIEIPLEQEVKIGEEVEVPVRKTLVSPNIKRIYRKHGKVVNFSTKEGEMDSLGEL
jgi:alanine racemase